MVIESAGRTIGREAISDLHTTEFRMMLTLMVKVMRHLPEASDLLFFANDAFIMSFDEVASAMAANPDWVQQCIEAKARHRSVAVKIVAYHKSKLLIETHAMATEAMAQTRKRFHSDRKRITPKP